MQNCNFAYNFVSKTCYPKLRKQYMLKVFENTKLRRILGPNRDEILRGCNKWHTEEFRKLYSSPNIYIKIKSKRMIRAGNAARKGAKRKAYRILVGKTEGKRPLGRTRRRWEDNTQENLRETGQEWNGMDNIKMDLRDIWWGALSLNWRLWRSNRNSDSIKFCWNSIRNRLQLYVVRTNYLTWRCRAFSKQLSQILSFFISSLPWLASHSTSH
jgi:hypothetical protein